MSRPRTWSGPGIGPGVERLLIKTANSGRLNACGRRFHEDFIALAPDAARWIAARPIRLVGVDALSVDPFDSAEHPAHGLLLGKGVVVVEGLDLSGVEPGAYWLACPAASRGRGRRSAGQGGAH